MRCPVCRRRALEPGADPMIAGWAELKIVAIPVWVCPSCAGGIVGALQLATFLKDIMEEGEGEGGPSDGRAPRD